MLLALLVPAALAAGPSVGAYDTQLAIAYHDTILGLLDGDHAAVSSFLSSYDRESARVDLEAQVATTIVKLDDLGPFEGDDSLRQAVLVYEEDFLSAVIAGDGTYDDDAAFAPVSSAEKSFAGRWNFGLHDTPDAPATPAAQMTTVAPAPEPAPAPHSSSSDGWVAYRGGLDRGEGRHGYDLGVSVDVSPKVAIDYDFRHAKLDDPTQHRQALGLGVDYDLLHLGGDTGLTLAGKAGVEWGWGQGSHAAGVLLGAEADVDVPGPFFAYGDVERGLWGGAVKDDLGGWMLDAGVGVRIR